MAEAGAGLTVVCVTFNSSAVIASAIESVRRVLPGAAVLVVDNASTDDTVATARTAGAAILETGANLGFGAAVNRGVQAAGTEYVLVLNPDARVVRSTWPAVAAQPAFGLVALSETERGGDGSVSGLVRPELPWFIELPWSLANWLLVPREVDWRRPRTRRQRLDGAAFIVRRDEFIAVGGFDERLFLYYEDNQLTDAYRHAGLPLRVSDAVVIEHDSAGSSPRLHERVVAWALLSQLQGVFIARGSAAGQRASWFAVRGLDAIIRAGAAGSVVPLLAPRAAKKRDSAASILRHLVAESETPPREDAFPDSAAAVLRVAGPAPR